MCGQCLRNTANECLGKASRWAEAPGIDKEAEALAELLFLETVWENVS